MKKNLIIFLLCLFVINAWGVSKQELATSRYFETIQNNPQQLLNFLRAMPKGADLHNHLGGASMAENMIQYAQQDHLCIDANNNAVMQAPCPFKNKLENISKNSPAYNKMIDAWSMRNFHSMKDVGKESGHDHFFATFEKYAAILSLHRGEMIAEVADRAGEQNEQYLELMITPDDDASGMLGSKIGWNPNFAILRQTLLAKGLNNIINNISKIINRDEKIINKTLYCQTNQAKLGCQVKIKYLYQILREQPPVNVFAQLLTGFEIASKDPRFVGINMVQPEDGIIAMRDYKLHMQMIGFLHQLYPKVHISLHAGELTNTLVPAAGLRFHIRDAVEVAHAERIGHGVAVASENHAQQLLKEMAEKNILVEINLASNAAILNVTGKNHPLPLYLQNKVPVALSTDDEGVLRSNLTNQYVIAVTLYHFSYPTLKMLVRNSITYSFLPGKNLWQDRQYHQVVAACRNNLAGSQLPAPACQAFLNANEKAAMQWALEKRFSVFENKFTQSAD